MKTLTWTLCVAALLFARPTLAEEKTEVKTDKDKISYSIGQQIGTSLKEYADDLDIAMLIVGIKDKLAGVEGKVKKEDAEKLLMAFSQELQAKIPEKHKKAGEKYLAENKNKDGVKTLASGLQYQVIKEGDGDQPKATDTVTTHYKGMLTDGTEFDSSIARGQPAEFPVGGVIKGWTEALQLMKTGAKWKLFIPSELAYGARGTPDGRIPPNSVLVFEIELLSIKK